MNTHAWPLVALAALTLAVGCRSVTPQVVTGHVRIQAGSNVVDISQPKDTRIQGLEFDPSTGLLVLKGYESTANAAAITAAESEAKARTDMMTAMMGMIQSMAVMAAKAAAPVPMPSPAVVTPTAPANPSK